MLNDAIRIHSDVPKNYIRTILLLFPIFNVLFLTKLFKCIT